MEFSKLDNIVYLIIPFLALIILILGYRKRDNIIKYFNFKAIYRFKIAKTILIVLGIILIAFSLLDPQIFRGYKEVEKKGLDIYILLDTSKSMLAEDIKPNRLFRMKKSIEKVLNSLQGDRVGFIPFASDAYIQMPLTDDYDLAKMFLEVIDTDMIAGGGTNIAAGLDLAQESFDKSAKGDKVILIFSDGEEHNQGAVRVAKEIENEKIYTIGLGTKEGALIPEYSDSGQKIGYKKDQVGNYVNSKLNINSLQEIAKVGAGKFYLSTLKGDEIDHLIDNILKLKRQEYRKDKIKKFTKIYQYFLGTGILIFLIGYFLKERSDHS
ncbi:VWA domain-containing protein [Orenia marismortui]|uniref:VWA domain-containing protein n=1 Tax=Orenia marismortui TaxID=46469 RepID=UPI00035C89C6|nr:VWA domain-containing protein [Orenia marismortui]